MEAEEDLEKQRLFYDTVRETIVSGAAASSRFNPLHTTFFLLSHF